MANNRMYLVHKPTGYAFPLGKHMAGGWYGQPADMGESLAEYLDECFMDSGSRDSFAIAMESSDDPNVITDWEWDQEETGIGRLTMKLKTVEGT